MHLDRCDVEQLWHLGCEAINALLVKICEQEAEVESLKRDNNHLRNEVASVRDEFCGDCEYLPKAWHS